MSKIIKKKICIKLRENTKWKKTKSYEAAISEDKLKNMRYKTKTLKLKVL